MTSIHPRYYILCNSKSVLAYTDGWIRADWNVKHADEQQRESPLFLAVRCKPHEDRSVLCAPAKRSQFALRAGNGGVAVSGNSSGERTDDERHFSHPLGAIHTQMSSFIWPLNLISSIRKQHQWATANGQYRFWTQTAVYFIGFYYIYFDFELESFQKLL